MQINIAERVQALYSSLRAAEPEQPLSEFLLDHCQYCADVQRVLAYPQQPYGEIRANIVGSDCHPIDLLRLKLSMFGGRALRPQIGALVTHHPVPVGAHRRARRRTRPARRLAATRCTYP